MKTVNVADLQRALAAKKRLESKFCLDLTCSKKTCEGKDYCSDHVDLQPYAAELMRKQAERDAQDERVVERGAKSSDLSGLTAVETLQALELYGARTVERLVRDVNVDQKVLEAYLAAFEREGVVILSPNRRGRTIARLAKKDQDRPRRSA